MEGGGGEWRGVEGDGVEGGEGGGGEWRGPGGEELTPRTQEKGAACSRVGGRVMQAEPRSR